MNHFFGKSLVLAVFVTSIQASAKVEMRLADTGEVGVSISGTELKSPVEVGGSSGSAIYFEVDGKTNVLLGKPTTTADGADGLSRTWDVAGRKITLEVLPDGKNYQLNLRAQPTEGIEKWGFGIAAAESEFFTGCMERITDSSPKGSWKAGLKTAMNLRGEKVEMKVKSTLGLYAPFFVSSRGYGLFTHGTWQGEYVFPAEGKADAVQVSFAGPQLKMTLYAGGVLDAVKTHMMETGPAFLPPKWAFLPWRWRDDHANKTSYYDGSPVSAPYNSDLVEDVLMMDALQIPCGVYWVDRPWGPGKFGYSDFEWDRKRLPEPEKMIRWLDRRSIKFMLWIAPWAEGTQMKKEATDRGFLAPNDASGIDLTNPDAVRWWQMGLKKVLDVGVAGFKLDRGDELEQKATGTLHDGRDWKEASNDYSRMYLKAVHDICREVRGDDFCLIPRAGYTGSAKYGAFWGGDTGATEWGLRSTIVAMQKCSVIGFPLWGCDTGGYPGRGGDGYAGNETMMRWLAFSCFCPIMEVGPTINKGLWELGDDVTAAWRVYAQIHAKLKDYSYSCAKECHDTGMPIVRPLWLIYPDQNETWNQWQTFLYGPDILVSAIWEKGDSVERSVYLPAGDTWIDAWSGATHKGGATIQMHVTLHQIPIFIRQGSRVDLGDLNQLWQESDERVKNKPRVADLEKHAAFQ